MLFVNPRSATIELGAVTVTLDDVERVAINRRAARTIAEGSDAGEFTVFADVPSQRVEVVMRRRLSASTRGLEAALTPGAQGEVTIIVGPGASDARRQRVRFTGVVRSVEHELSGERATQGLTFIGVSSDGATDPITVEEIE